MIKNITENNQVIISWKEDPNNISKKISAPKLDRGVIFYLQNHLISTSEVEFIESYDWMLVEIPIFMKDSSEEDLRNYFNSQIDETNLLILQEQHANSFDKINDRLKKFNKISEDTIDSFLNTNK